MQSRHLPLKLCVGEVDRGINSLLSQIDVGLDHGAIRGGANSFHRCSHWPMPRCFRTSALRYKHLLPSLMTGIPTPAQASRSSSAVEQWRTLAMVLRGNSAFGCAVQNSVTSSMAGAVVTLRSFHAHAAQIRRQRSLSGSG